MPGSWVSAEKSCRQRVKPGQKEGSVLQAAGPYVKPGQGYAGRAAQALRVSVMNGF